MYILILSVDEIAQRLVHEVAAYSIRHMIDENGVLDTKNIPDMAKYNPILAMFSSTTLMMEHMYRHLPRDLKYVALGTAQWVVFFLIKNKWSNNMQEIP